MTGNQDDAAALELLDCEMPGGCSNRIEYSGVGRKPKYCAQVVGGVLHSRLNAQKARNGQLVLPAAGSRPQPDTAAPRPVSLARAGIEVLRDQIAAALAEHRDSLGGLIGRFEEAVATATDPDAAAAEVTAAHREARTQIDAAETARDSAEAAARLAAAEAQAARVATQQAETAAEDALAEVDDLTTERDVLRADRTALAAELDRSRDQHATVARHRDELADQLRAAADQDAAQEQQLAALRDEIIQLHTQLGAEQRRVAELERRTELAEQRADRGDTAIASLGQQLDATRADATAQRDITAEVRAELAAATATVAGMRAQLDVERAHGQQRVDDAAVRHTEQLAELAGRHRTELAQLRERLGEATGRVSSVPNPAPAPRRTGSSPRPGSRAQPSAHPETDD